MTNDTSTVPQTRDSPPEQNQNAILNVAILTGQVKPVRIRDRKAEEERREIKMKVARVREVPEQDAAQEIAAPVVDSGSEREAEAEYHRRAYEEKRREWRRHVER